MRVREVGAKSFCELFMQRNSFHVVLPWVGLAIGLIGIVRMKGLFA